MTHVAQDGPDGVDVCLSCFDGGCVGNSDRHHARTHHERTGHQFSLNIKRTPKPKAERGDNEPPAKITKLAILEEREEDRFDWTTTLRCWACAAGEDGKLLPELSADATVKKLANGVMTSMSSSRQSEVKAWEEEILACEHTLALNQDENRGQIDAAGAFACGDMMWRMLVLTFNLRSGSLQPV